VLLVGDCNCHFGKNDSNIEDSEYFGKILLHEETNNNGDEFLMLCELLQLNALTTMSHPSTKVTWTNNTISSQLDHIFVPKNSLYKLTKLRGAWSKVATDHKLLSWTLIIPLNEPQNGDTTFPDYSIYYSKSWDLSALSVDTVREEFNSLVAESINKCGNDSLSWGDLCSIACFCSESLLKKKKNTYTEEQQAVYLNYRNTLNNIMKSRLVDLNPSLVDPAFDYPPTYSPGSINLLRCAYKALQKSKEDKSLNALNTFLSHLNDNVSSPGQKVNMAFDYLKVTKRTTSYKCSTSISFKQWDLEQSKLEGEFVNLIQEFDFHPILPPPSFNDMLLVVKGMKNNKTPGLDNMCIEFLKSSEVLCYKLYKFIRRAYLTNEIPLEWQHTYSIPIPKTKTPKSTSDFRRLTMCSNGNKIYTALLMNILRNYLPSLPYYQSGFISNRSTNDLCFVMRNVLDYRWSRGRITYVISLDLKKAFDTVLTSKLPEVLLSYNVPHFMINRVIAAVLTEFNSIYWKGQLSHPISKSLGIKQGCKISPELFIYILNVAVSKTKQELLSYQINLCIGKDDDELLLPAFLAYADDCYLLCHDIHQGLFIVTVLMKHLSEFGLQVNYDKSSVLIKDPSNSTHPSSFPLGDSSIPVVANLKVLGSPINSNMNRKSSVKPRILTAMKLFRVLLPYLKNLKAPMDLLIKLCATIIVPSMLYGLNCSSMTKANARTLMNREIYILRMLADIAHPRPPQTTFSNLLNNKTINRKATVARLRYYYHVRRSDRRTLIIKSLFYTENAKRKIGRPIYDFSKTLSLDFRKYLELGIAKSDMDRDFELRDVIKNLTAKLYKREDLSDDPLPIDLKLYPEVEELPLES
jgi:hypothetical protein